MTTGDGQSFGPVSRGLGLLAALMERWDDAERHFRDSLAQSEKMGHRPALAQTRVNYADMLLRRDAAGDRKRATGLLQEALDAAQEIGMAKLIEDCERLLGDAQANE